VTVAAAVDSVRPYPSKISMPAPAKNAAISRLSGEPPQMA
jgi:hypothetical protein